MSRKLSDNYISEIYLYINRFVSTNCFSIYREMFNNCRKCYCIFGQAMKKYCPTVTWKKFG